MLKLISCCFKCNSGNRCRHIDVATRRRGPESLPGSVLCRRALPVGNRVHTMCPALVGSTPKREALSFSVGAHISYRNGHGASINMERAVWYCKRARALGNEEAIRLHRAEHRMHSVLPRCSGQSCHQALGKLERCGGCLQVYYCGVDCQRSHWHAGHRRNCELFDYHKW